MHFSLFWLSTNNFLLTTTIIHIPHNAQHKWWTHSRCVTAHYFNRLMSNTKHISGHIGFIGDTAKNVFISMFLAINILKYICNVVDMNSVSSANPKKSDAFTAVYICPWQRHPYIYVTSTCTLFQSGIDAISVYMPVYCDLNQPYPPYFTTILVTTIMSLITLIWSKFCVLRYIA